MFDRLPGLAVAVVAGRELQPSRDASAVEALWTNAWRGAAAHAVHGNAQSHPRVRPWRESFRAHGWSGKDHPSSIEALLRRALKGKEPFRVTPLVDFYNAVSLRHVLPAGGFDLDHLDGDLEVRVTREGDTFHALDEDAPSAVPPGELAYCVAGEVLTRHLVWRQSRRGLIGRDTRNVVLVSEALQDVGGDAAEAVRGDLERGLARHFGARTRASVLDRGTPAVPLD
ncbi:MAG TPA: phenylalanine--tRNA ligase beta subunit-related protein [Gemmatimonadota bacterium]